MSVQYSTVHTIQYSMILRAVRRAVGYVCTVKKILPEIRTKISYTVYCWNMLLNLGNFGNFRLTVYESLEYCQMFRTKLLPVCGLYT